METEADLKRERDFWKRSYLQLAATAEKMETALGGNVQDPEASRALADYSEARAFNRGGAAALGLPDPHSGYVPSAYEGDEDEDGAA